MLPKISVVLASHNARHSILECLNALKCAAAADQAEIIVVDNSQDGTADLVAKQFPEVTLLSESKDSLIPHLWEAGIRVAQGEIVALTTTHFVPESDWPAQILKAHAGPYAGIGGAIEEPKSSTVVSKAIYFCRYSAYMLEFGKREVSDFAADNGSYKRSLLQRYESARRQGFWESPIHAQMVQDGLKLLLTPEIVVSHRQSFSFTGFIEQRFHHGRQYGSDRARNFSRTRRMFHIMGSPLIPAVFLWRITRRVISRKGDIAGFLTALPVLFVFLLSWSAGELTGYMSRPVKSGLNPQLAKPQA